jgi:hypothetical protein
MRWNCLFLPYVLFMSGCAKPPDAVSYMASVPVAASTPVPVKKAPALQVEILISEDIPAYKEVADELVKLLGTRGTISMLTASKLNTNEHRQFVSIGLNAAIASKYLKNRQLVFCQVYNYQDYALVSSKHKGVSMLPSLPQIFNTWRVLSPQTTNIGVISGPGMEDVIALAKARQA